MADVLGVEAVLTALATVPLGRDIVVAEDLVLRNGVKVSLHLRGPERSVWAGRTGPARPRCSTPCGGDRTPLGHGVATVPYRLLPQRLQVLDDNDSVLVAVSRLAPTADDNQLRAELRLDADTVARPVAALSGGERFRATLAPCC